MQEADELRTAHAQPLTTAIGPVSGLGGVGFIEESSSQRLDRGLAACLPEAASESTL